MDERFLTAAYRWKKFPDEKPKPSQINECFSVSTPANKNCPRTVGLWAGDHFRDLNECKMEGVTFWACLPQTPEDLIKEFKAEKTLELKMD